MFDVAVENAFDFRSREYADLFRASAATAFQHPVWLAHLYGTLTGDAAIARLVLVVRRRADGGLAMVLPLLRRRYALLQVVEFADLHVCDYASPIAARAVFSQIATDEAAVVAINRHLMPYDLLRVSKLSGSALPIELLFPAKRRKRMDLNAYASALEPAFGRWRDKHLSRTSRKKLQKKTRQLHRKGEVRFTCAQSPADICMTFDALKRFRGQRFRARGGPVDLVQLPSYFAFYSSVAVEGRDGFARTYTLWLDDEPIAGAFGLSHRGSFLVVLVGFDAARHGRQSVGSLMFEQIARDCIERGEQSLDFTIGDEPYKRMFGAEPSPMWSFSQASNTLGLAAKLAVETLPVVKSLARRFWPPQ
ncbi:UNVERIFIED_ORG: GNAT family N-acetyltransferase [Roseateles sp. XES5]|nr:GNAT family N-acetyltransferase [Roseateles sp. XES5]